MSETQSIPVWSRVLDFIFGLIAIILAAYILSPMPPIAINPPTYSPGMYILFAPAAILLGLLWLIRGFIYKDNPGWLRGLTTLFGILILVIGTLVTIFDTLGLPTIPLSIMTQLHLFLPVALILDGLGWILWMLTGNAFGWFKWVGLLLGIVILIIAAVGLVLTTFVVTLTLYVIITSGLVLIIKGIAGQ